MKTLYIIGNGYDLAHGLCTCYKAFHEWLDDHKDKYEKAYYFIDLIDGLTNNIELWSDLEKALGEIEAEELFKNITEEYKETQEKDDWVAQSDAVYAGIEYFLKDYYQELLNAFRDWARDIQVDEDEIEEIKYPQLMNNKEDYFFTFNYTPTLEKIYHIPTEHIKHIHGDYTGKTQIIVGHATDYSNVREKLNVIDDDQLPADVGDSVDKMIEMLNMSQKDTDRIIAENSDYFKGLKKLGIERVVVIGHSYSEVDYPYFAKIKNSCPGIPWEMNWLTNGDYDRLGAYENNLGITTIKTKVISDNRCEVCRKINHRV